MGCWSITGFRPILLGQEKQVGLSVLLKDRDNQIVTWLGFEPQPPTLESGALPLHQCYPTSAPNAVSLIKWWHDYSIL
jgi:hypothetical protein